MKGRRVHVLEDYHCLWERSGGDGQGLFVRHRLLGRSNRRGRTEASREGVRDNGGREDDVWVQFKIRRLCARYRRAAVVAQRSCNAPDFKNLLIT